MAFDTTDRPRFTLFAGPNGAGKTTAYRRFLDAGCETGEYLNPDDIARSLGADETAVEIKAGREVIRRTRSLIAARRPFVRETTLSGREILRSVSDARSSNYRVVMVFVGIRSWKTARSRVTFRVASGGHDIPRQDQERRLPPFVGQRGSSRPHCRCRLLPGQRGAAAQARGDSVAGYDHFSRLFASRVAGARHRRFATSAVALWPRRGAVAVA